jgi:hypothetical protein
MVIGAPETAVIRRVAAVYTSHTKTLKNQLAQTLGAQRMLTAPSGAIFVPRANAIPAPENAMRCAKQHVMTAILAPLTSVTLSMDSARI